MSLVLTLNPGQVVYIGDDIEIWARRQPNSAKQVKIYIRAPKEIHVKRGPADETSDEYIQDGGNKSGAV